MKNKHICKLLSLLFVLSLSGCVTKTKYEQLDSQTKNLDSRIAKIDAKNKRLALEIEKLKSDKEKMQLRNEELSRVNQRLAGKNKELATEITEYRRKSMHLETELVKKEEKLDELQQTQNDLAKSLKKEIAEGNVKIEELKGMLKVNVVSELLFDSGQAKVSKRGKLLLDKVASSLASVKDKRIEIQGHTDNQKIGGTLKSKFQTNWELSSARATGVVRHLQSKGVNPEILTASGYSKYHPVMSNKTEAGRSKNRRIEIILLPLIQ